MLPTPLADGPVAPDDESSSPTPSPRPLLAVLLVVLVLLGVIAWEATRPSGPPAPPPGSWTVVPYSGLGAWVDVYDWTHELGGASPSVGLDDVDAMADAGVQTLFLQTSHRRSAADVIEPERLEALIERAHANDLHVVAWYLPTFEDVAVDLRRLIAAAELPVDGLGVDIEATVVTDATERTRRLLDLSTRLRAAVGADKALGAITLSSTHVQVVNPDFWPAYPWAELASTYDVLLPMSYWSIRRGDLHDGARYIGEDIDRIWAAVGRSDIPIHPIGGIADGTTVAEIEGMVGAIVERGGIGGSLYDWSTSDAAERTALGPLRDLRTLPTEA